MPFEAKLPIPQSSIGLGLPRVSEVISSARKGLGERVVVFCKDIGTLVAHQQHLREQVADTRVKKNELSVTSPAQPNSEVVPSSDSREPISPSIKEYLDEVM